MEPETQEGNIRIDTLDPDLLHGNDVNWWLEVVAVLSNGEMPPADEAELADEDRSKVIEWLSSEIQVASTVRRAEQGHSSFRRMTRYEYNYALQDLLGLPYDFAKDLPPESTSEDGFQNSSEMLHMSAVQFGTYRELSRNALKRATVQGERPAADLLGRFDEGRVGRSVGKAGGTTGKDQAAAQRRSRKAEAGTGTAGCQVSRQAQRCSLQESDAQAGPREHRGVTAGAKYAWKPTTTRPEVPAVSDHVAIIPPRQKLIVELGDTVPDEGTLRVRVRASRTSVEDNRIPSLQLEFGWQASNDSAGLRPNQRPRCRHRCRSGSTAVLSVGYSAE